jgi:hypothetical protein
MPGPTRYKATIGNTGNNPVNALIKFDETDFFESCNPSSGTDIVVTVEGEFSSGIKFIGADIIDVERSSP